jgi:uncharacterized membrane protein
MAQAATRQRSAVREEHAAHPTHPEPASKPGKSASVKPGRRRRSGHESGARGAERGTGGKAGRPELGELPKPHLPELNLPKPHLSIWARMAAKILGKILKRVAKHELHRLTQGTNWSLESVGIDEVGELKDKLGGMTPDTSVLKPELPIQESVDVAVPVSFAWSEWMELRSLPEGVDRVVEIERDGGGLTGQLEGESNGRWSAEVLDEREGESFAWKSTEGSDCAGLVTFHALSERLTRLELTLDVLPRDPLQSAQLLTHVAHRHARKELRRFKADLEVVSPDVYADDEHSSSQ